MRISKKTVALLKSLVNGESVASSSLPKHISETLCTEGFLTVRTMGSRTQTVTKQDVAAQTQVPYGTVITVETTDTSQQSH